MFSIQEKNDKDVVLAAVREYRYAFRLASDVLQTDPDVVRAFRFGTGRLW